MPSHLFSNQGRLARLWAHRDRVLIRLGLAIAVLVFLLPIVWAVSSSLKTRGELYQAVPSLVTLNPTLANYEFTLRRMPAFATYFRNSIVVTLGAVAIQVFAASLAGYAFARLTFRGRDAIFYTIVLLVFVPRVGALMAQYEVMHFLGLRNSLPGLILIFSSGLAVPTFIMRQTFLNLPGVFEDAALVDGCNRWQVFWRVMAPMGASGMVIVALFEFIRVWGEYLVTLTMIDERSLFTLGIGIAMLFLGATQQEGEFTSYGAESAGYLLAALPAMVFFVLLQRWFLRGLMEGLKL